MLSKQNINESQGENDPGSGLLSEEDDRHGTVIQSGKLSDKVWTTAVIDSVPWQCMIYTR